MRLAWHVKYNKVVVIKNRHNIIIKKIWYTSFCQTFTLVGFTISLLQLKFYKSTVLVSNQKLVNKYKLLIGETSPGFLKMFFFTNFSGVSVNYL